MIFKKTIISEFFTTLSFSQLLSSFYLMTFWAYKLRYWKDIELFEKELLKYLWKNNSKIISFYSWRNAIYNALKIIWVWKKDEIIINSYTCSVVSNSTIKSGAKIIYSDIENQTFSFDYEKLQKKINKNTKVIILQHTFWKQARDYKKIINLALEKNILIIEDRAHSLWNEVELLWDFVIYSSGRDKVISSVTWWFLLINNSNYFKKIDKIKSKLKMPSIKLTYQNLAYNVIWYISYKFYDFFKLWKMIIFLSRKLNFITEILNKKEREFKSKKFNLWFPNSLAYLARKQLNFLDYYNKVRLENAKYYLDNIKNDKIEILFKDLDNYNWFRFPILLKNEKEKDNFYNYMKKNNILLGNYWTWQNIIPSWINLKKAKYDLWSCKIWENISKRILTLANHKLINKKDLEKIIKILNKF